MFDYLKTIFFGITIIVLFTKIFFKKDLGGTKFFIGSIFITIIFFISIELKIHHYLRSHLGISNTITFSLIAIIVFYYFLKFRYDILKSKYMILLISICFLMLAVISDLLNDAKIIVFTGYDVFEELLRISGAIFWLLFFTFGVNKNQIC